ncbi:MAG: MBL fold metallo-hydrolase RNA specificity domain-containing protein [Candidatus Binatia bacterium]
MTRLKFLGAAGTVTGSRFLLEAGSRRVLIDCGLFQGKSELRQKNWGPLGVDPGAIDAVILTHAHIDHTGYLPRLVKNGFTGPVFASAPTKALLNILLPDAARLQEEEARYANEKGYSRHKPALPLFTDEDARRALKLVRGSPFGSSIEIAPDLCFTFHRAGHILGAAFVLVETGRAAGEKMKIVFSGDVGRKDIPILKDPEPIAGADYVVLESTYGDRLHGGESSKEALARVCQGVIEKGSVLLVPAFAVGRTQEVLYHLRALQREGRLSPRLPIYIDSPMAISAVDLYCDYTPEHDIEMTELRDQERCPIQGPSVSFSRSSDDSKSLNRLHGPAVIISASGMLSGGRVLHHLVQRLPNPDTTLLFVGYQAEGTLGRRILEGEREVRVLGQAVPVAAHIEEIPALSAHADSGELLEWMSAIPAKPREIFLVHGEDRARAALAASLRDKLGFKVSLPRQDENREL